MNKTETSKERALLAIEKLVSADFIEDMSFNLAKGRYRNEGVKELVTIVNKIYMISHAENGHCRNPHPEWLKIKDTILDSND